MIDKTKTTYYNKYRRKTKASFNILYADVAELAEVVRKRSLSYNVSMYSKYLQNLTHADVAELADAQDLKSCG